MYLAPIADVSISSSTDSDTTKPIDAGYDGAETQTYTH